MKQLFQITLSCVLLLVSCKNLESPKIGRHLTAITQTTPMPNNGDAADDPAIWVNFENPEKSLLIGTNKKQGIHVYNLSGKEIYKNKAGRINNIDVRYGFKLSNDSLIDLVAGSNRSNNTISLFKIDKSGTLQDMNGKPIQSQLAVYGFCLYKDLKNNKFYAFVNAKSGKVEQWQLVAAPNNKIDGILVRTFKLESQPEGCVCDDEKGIFYIGEEDKGIWKFSASPSGGDKRKLIADFTNKYLKPDIEGLTLYYAPGGKGYLLASSQGNSSFAVFERDSNNRYLGSFRITNGAKCDGVEETDGIDVTNYYLGKLYPDGLFIAQDGINEENGEKVNQNFKMVSWRDIAGQFTPPLIIDNKYLINKQSILK
jgi:3-phytase